ncbi:MAG: energy transducer TonB, partial [Pyrinomonadaceae bacterium]
DGVPDRTPNVVGSTPSIAIQSKEIIKEEVAPPKLPEPVPVVKNQPPVSKGVINGIATSLPKPAFPPAAKAVHAGGEVKVQVLIDERGNVVSATPVSGHPLLRSAAQIAARQAKFTPTQLSNQPVKVTGFIIYNFVAQ